MLALGDEVADAIVRVARTIIRMTGRLGDVVDDAHLNVARIRGDVVDVLIFRRPCLFRFDEEVFGERLDLPEIRAARIERVLLRFRTTEALREDRFEIELVVEKRLRVDHDVPGLVVDGRDRCEADDRLRKVVGDREPSCRRIRCHEGRVRPEDRDVVARAFEANELGRKMVGIPPHGGVAAEAVPRNDRLHEIVIELRGRELEIDLAVLMPDGEESALRLSAFDERRVGNDIGRLLVDLGVGARERK